MNNEYVHGYDEKANIRLQDQASTLVELLHSDTYYPPGSRVLEAGCGVGAQTSILALNSPDALITSIDISKSSVVSAKRVAENAGLQNIGFVQANIFELPFFKNYFDHIFVCFVLEHLPNPLVALNSLKNVLKPGGTITVIEGDHGSTFFHPHSDFAINAIKCQVELQKMSGGNALIGRELYPLLTEAGFDSVKVSPRMVYVDSTKPEMVDGFTRKTFTAMIEGVRDDAILAGLSNEKELAVRQHGDHRF